MLRFLTGFSVALIFSNMSFADNLNGYQEPSQATQKQISKQIQEQLKAAEAAEKDAEFLKSTAKTLNQVKNMAVPKSMSMVNVREEDISANNKIDFNQLEGNNTYNVGLENRMTPLVLVSLSMPENVLKDLKNETSRYDGTITFRGVKNDNLKTMRNEFERMGLAGQIDPSYFRRFSVTEVPTFIMPLEPVALCDSDFCPSSRYVKVAGLVSVETALEFIARNSKEKEAKAIAEQWLDKLRSK